MVPENKVPCFVGAGGQAPEAEFCLKYVPKLFLTFFFFTFFFLSFTPVTVRHHEPEAIRHYINTRNQSISCVPELHTCVKIQDNCFEYSSKTPALLEV